MKCGKNGQNFTTYENTSQKTAHVNVAWIKKHFFWLTPYFPLFLRPSIDMTIQKIMCFLQFLIY